MNRLRDEQGVALVAAIVLLIVMMGLGLALLLYANNQQEASAREQASEAAFNVAEAALNAQVGQLSRQWPISEGEVPTSCTAATPAATPANDCPSPSDLNSDPNTGSTTCSGTDAWGSPLSNQWTTYVREPESATSSLFNSATEQTALPYDKELWGKLWVRSVGVVQCHAVTLVTLVSRQTIALNFPENAVTGNWFKVTNEGKKTIINRQGAETEPGAVSMRCSGFTGTQAEIEKECEKWNESKKQVSPAITENPTSPSTTLTATEMASLKKEAQERKTYYSASAPYHCPTSITELAGKVTYIEGCGALKVQGTGTANTATSPGFLVIANGTLALGGSSTFYGIIYAANLENLSGTVVELFGRTTVVGAIDVDGNGGIEFGSSGNGGGNAANLEYSSTAFRNLTISAGAAATRNSFRILPAGQ